MNKITIVTVCYNAEETIKNTIESVLSQNYCNYEYIVIDGKSTDNTLTILNDYRKGFQEKGIDYYIYSEKDNGIYDAMNKGIEHSLGDWIILMNADDSFYSSDVLTQVFDKDLKLVLLQDKLPIIFFGYSIKILSFSSNFNLFAYNNFLSLNSIVS